MLNITNQGDPMFKFLKKLFVPKATTENTSEIADDVRLATEANSVTTNTAHVGQVPPKPATKPASKATTKPAAKQVSKPVTKAAAKPVQSKKPVAKPVAKTTAKKPATKKVTTKK